MDRADIQGIVLHGYRGAPCARYHLLRFGTGDARGWLTRTVVDVSSAAEARAAVRQNVAFSAPGLRALGLEPAEMSQFSREFRQGMAHPERARVLGARGDAEPSLWEFGGPHDELGAVSMTFAKSEAMLAERCAPQEALLKRFGIAWTAQDAWLKRTDTGTGTPKKTQIAMGEFVLGYRDAVGERARGPFVPVKASARALPPWSSSRNALDFGANGSYLVVQKLEDRGLVPPEAKAALEREHARRALGPDASTSHPLLRRSRRYGPAAGEASAARGLWFMAFNADIRRQFEFVHENYLSGALEAPSAQPAHTPDLSRLVRLRGGGYFFAPGIRALNYLAESTD